jgi:anti-anti-sigma factor
MGNLGEHFLAAFECVPDPLLVLSGDRVVMSNAAARALFGREGLAGELVEALLDVEGGLGPRLRRALEGAREPMVARRHSPMAGAPLTLMGTLGPLDPQAGVERGLVLCLHRASEVLRDTAETLRASENRYRSMLASAPGFIMVTDDKGVALDMNHPPPGYTREQVLGANIADMSAPEHLARVREALAAVRRGEQATFESMGPGRDGPGTQWYQVTVGPMHERGSVARVIWFVTDIGERKRMEREIELRAEELAENNRRLSHEIEERRSTEALLRSLSAPIIRVWSDVLALPVIGAVDHARATQMMQRLLEEIVQSEATTAVLDLTGVDRVDQETARYLVDIAKAVRLLGSRCFLSGVSPAVARTMVELGADVSEMETFGRLSDALRRAIGPARLNPS